MTDSLRYPTRIWFSEEDEGYIAVVPDLPGCSAFGETQEEALAELKDAINAWIGAAQKAGNPVPAPSRQPVDDLPSGKILLRLPKTLHAQLLERAAREATSLNTCLVMLLSKSLEVSQASVGGQAKDLDQFVQLPGTAFRKLASHQILVFERAMATEEVRTVTRGGSTLNLVTLPANKPVVYLEDDNG